MPSNATLPAVSPRAATAAAGAALREHTPECVLGLAAAVLLIFVGYPLLWLVLGGFGIPRGPTAAFFPRVLATPANLNPLVNTVALAVEVGVASVLLGVPLAWAAARTDLPLRRLVHGLMAVSYILPPYLTSLAYIILLGPNAGHFNRLLIWLFHLPHGPINIFSTGGIVFVIAMHVFAFPYFLTYGALQSLDAPFEEAAQLLGANRWVIARRITFPLVAPAITGGALLAAVDSMALFGPQAILGLPAQIVYLPTRIYGAITSYPPRFPEASVLSLILVGLTVIGLSLQRRYLERRSFVTVGGRGVRGKVTPLGSLKWPWLALCLLIVFFSAVAPLAVLLAAAVSKVWTDPLTLGNLTFSHFAMALFGDQTSVRGIANSFKLAVGAASLAMAVGLAIAYIDVRTTVRGRRVLDYLAILPLGLSGTVMAVALLQAFLRPPFRLYGTIWILLVAYVVRFIPLAARSANASLRQVDVALEEAARITGGTWLRSVWLIVVPIVRRGLLLAWLLVFIPALTELSATILLYTSGTETISVAIFRLNDLGQLEVVAALAVFVIAVIFLATLLTQWLGAKHRGEMPGELVT